MRGSSIAPCLHGRIGLFGERPSPYPGRHHRAAPGGVPGRAQTGRHTAVHRFVTIPIRPGWSSTSYAPGANDGLHSLTASQHRAGEDSSPATCLGPSVRRKCEARQINYTAARIAGSGVPEYRVSLALQARGYRIADVYCHTTGPQGRTLIYRRVRTMGRAHQGKREGRQSRHRSDAGATPEAGRAAGHDDPLGRRLPTYGPPCNEAGAGLFVSIHNNASASRVGTDVLLGAGGSPGRAAGQQPDGRHPVRGPGASYWITWWCRGTISRRPGGGRLLTTPPRRPYSCARLRQAAARASAGILSLVVHDGILPES